MKITDKTLDIFKNFAGINSGMILKKGTKQSTIAPDDAIYVEATLTDDFPSDFGLYELPKFLTNLSLLESPELEFGGNVVEMRDKDGLTLTYRGCSPELIHAPSEKAAALKIDNPDVSLALSVSQIQKLLKVAAVNTFTHLTIFGSNGKLGVKVSDRASDTSNTGVMELGEWTQNTDFECVFKVEQLKIIPQNYNVTIMKDSFAIFQNQDNTLKYVIALEIPKKGKR